MQPYPALTRGGGGAPSDTGVTEPSLGGNEVPLLGSPGGPWCFWQVRFYLPFCSLPLSYPLRPRGPGSAGVSVRVCRTKRFGRSLFFMNCTLVRVLEKVGVLPPPPPPPLLEPCSVTSSPSWKYSGLNRANRGHLEANCSFAWNGRWASKGK